MAEANSEEKFKQDRYDARQAISVDPQGYVQDQLIAGGLGVMQATYAASDPRIKDGFAIAAAMGVAERQAGVNFEDLPLNQQNATLREALRNTSGTLLTDQINNPDLGFDPIGAGYPTSPNALIQRIAEPVTVFGRVDMKEQFVQTAANVLDKTSSTVAALVDAVGEKTATATVWGIQTAIGGIPKTALSFVMGKLTEPVRNYGTEKLSGVIQDYAFDINSVTDVEQRQNIKTVSDALGGFGVGLVLDNARGVISSAADTRMGITASTSVAALRAKFARDYNTWAATKGGAYVVRPGLDEIHHTLPLTHPGAVDARAHLDRLGVNYSDPKINGISLPKNAQVDNPFGKVDHNMTKTKEYSDYVNNLVLSAQNSTEATLLLQRLRTQLINGQTPWKN